MPTRKARTPEVRASDYCMAEKTPIVKPGQGGEAPAKTPDASIGTGDELDPNDPLDKQFIASQKSEVADNGQVPSETGPETETETTTETPVESGQEVVETATASETETEMPANTDGQPTSERELKRARVLAKEKKTLSQENEKLKRQLAIVRGEIQPDPPANPAATAPQPQRQTDYTSADYRAYARALQTAKENGQPIDGREVTDEQIEWAKTKADERMLDERLAAREQQRTAQRHMLDARERFVKQCAEIEALDPSFVLLDNNGRPDTTSEFFKEVDTRARTNGCRSMSDYIVAAYEVINQKRSREVQTAQAQTQQATTNVKKVLQQTALGGPAKARMPVANGKQATANKIAALRKRFDEGDEAAGDELSRLISSGAARGTAY